MPAFQIPFLVNIPQNISLRDVSAMMDKLHKNAIDNIPWPSFPDKPAAFFAIAYTENYLLIKYYVAEKFFRATYQRANDPVYKDSCVEFFIAFDNEKEYYNFEFNALGTCLLAFGEERDSRQYLPQTIIKKIKYHVILQSGNDDENNDNVKWELQLMIPHEVFCYHQISCLKEKKCAVNFYKCGDDLREPHYVAWANIISDEPNFHLREFFKEARFE